MANENTFLFREETKALVDLLTYIYDAVELINEKEGTSLTASDIIDVKEVLSLVQRSKLNNDPTTEELFELGNTLEMVREKLE